MVLSCHSSIYMPKLNMKYLKKTVLIHVNENLCENKGEKQLFSLSCNLPKFIHQGQTLGYGTEKMHIE